MMSAPSNSSLSVHHDQSIGIFALIAPLSVSTFLNTGINSEDVALSPPLPAQVTSPLISATMTLCVPMEVVE